MKVVQIVTQMEAAGAQEVAYQLHEGLSRKGHASELWFLYTKRPVVGLRGVSSIWIALPSVQEYLAIAGRLYRKLRQHRSDAVITHTQYANVLGQTVAAAVGVPKRIAVHHGPRYKGLHGCPVSRTASWIIPMRTRISLWFRSSLSSRRSLTYEAIPGGYAISATLWRT